MPIPKPQPFEKITAKERAYQQVKQWIIDGTLQPTEKLAETDLANAISVSRTPIREALLKLNEDGFVIMAPGKVTRVADLDLDAAEQLYEPMAAIEGLAARQTAQKVTNDQLSELQELEQAYLQATSLNNIEQILLADRNFHQAILDIANNSYEKQFSELLYGHIKRFEIYFFKNSQAKQINLTSQHDDLLTALKNHNQATAQQAMSNDWLDAMTILKKN